MSTSNRLPGVDGLRALAALWVVLFHITAASYARFPGVPGLDTFLKSGSTGVALFLVLSGFCLFLPFAGGRAERFKTREFFRRRFRRLAPAYYTSLVLSLLLALALAGTLGTARLTPAEVAWQLATHLTLSHSLFPDTFYALNGAYWSLGLEWQLYLGLPLLILGIKRFGVARTLGFAVACNVVYRLAIGLALQRGVLVAGTPLAEYVLPNQIFGRWAEFAFGMLAADLYVTKRLRHVERHVPLMLAAMVGLAGLALVTSQLELSHVVYGALYFVLLCTVLVSDNVVSRALSWRPLVVIGTMSYSLYLVHQPIIQSIGLWLPQNVPGIQPITVFAELLAMIPAILFVAWLLFVFVERRTVGAAAANVLVPNVSLRWPTLLAFRNAPRASKLVD